MSRRNKIKEIVNVTNTNPKRASHIPTREMPLTRTMQDVGKWRRALINAETPNFDRTEYYRMIKDVVLDSHLSAVIEQRNNGTLCRDVYYYNNDGTENLEITKLFKASWFSKLRCMILEAKYYGFTLIDLGEVVDFKFNTITQVSRQYVKPEMGIVIRSQGDETGIPIDSPKYAKWNIFVGEQYDLGLMMKAAPWALWKKTVTGYWSEYCEKFGMPMRIGKTNVQDDVLRENMFKELKNMGSAFSAVLNTDDDIQLLEAFSVAAYDIYDKFIERANSEMSKLILSQTGTTDEKTYAGSAGVHEAVLGSLVERDVLYHDNVLNELIKPVLIGLGFALNDGYFETGYEEKASLKDKVDMIAKFMPYVKFDKEYIEEEFGVVIESMVEQSKAEPTKKKINDTLRKYYDTL